MLIYARKIQRLLPLAKRSNIRLPCARKTAWLDSSLKVHIALFASTTAEDLLLLSELEALGDEVHE